MNELYETLGIEPSSSQAEIRRAYRKHAIVVHRGGVLALRDRMRKMRAALDVLGNPVTRREYDQAQEQKRSESNWWLHGHAPPPLPHSGERERLMTAWRKTERDARRIGDRAIERNRIAVDRLAREQDRFEERAALARARSRAIRLVLRVAIAFVVAAALFALLTGR